MTYNNIDTEKYQIMLHMVNVYAKKHEGIKPQFKYDSKAQTLEIGGISKPITFQTNTLGDIPAGEYEVVGEAVTSKTADGKTDINGMQNYKKSIVDVSNYPEVFDFINIHRSSTNCACCGTKRERNDFFYIRRADDPNHDMYQVGSSCVENYFDKSYFKLMKDLYSVVNESDRTAIRSKTNDCNLISYMSEYLYYRYSTESVTEAHKNAVAYSKDDKNIDPILKDRLKDNIERVLTYARQYDVGEDNKPALKTIQEMARMMNSDENADPFYSAAHCKEIGKECENLFWTANIYHAISDYSEKNPEYNVNMNDIFPIRIDADAKEVTDKNGKYMLNISRKSESEVYHACHNYMYKYTGPIRQKLNKMQETLRIENDLKAAHDSVETIRKSIMPMIEKSSIIERIDMTVNDYRIKEGSHGSALYCELTIAKEAFRALSQHPNFNIHIRDDHSCYIPIYTSIDNNEAINTITEKITKMETDYPAYNACADVEKRAGKILYGLERESNKLSNSDSFSGLKDLVDNGKIYISDVNAKYITDKNHPDKGHVTFKFRVNEEFDKQITIKNNTALEKIDEMVNDAIKDAYTKIKAIYDKERAETIAKEEAKNAWKNNVSSICETINAETNGELKRWLKIKGADTKIYDAPRSILFGHPDSGTYMEVRTTDDKHIDYDGTNYKGHITIDGKRITTGNSFTASDIKLFVDTFDPSKPKPQINMQTKPSSDIAKSSILSSTKKAIDELNQSLNGHVEYVGYTDEPGNAIVSLKITKNKNHIEGVRNIRVPKGLMHKSDMLQSKIRAKIITEFGLLKPTSKEVTHIPDKIDTDYVATNDSKTNDNPDV